MLSVTAGFTAAAAAAEDNQLVVSVAITTHTIVTHFITCVITVPFEHDFHEFHQHLSRVRQGINM